MTETLKQPASEIGLRLAIKECRLRESYAIRNLEDVAEGVNSRGWNDNLRRDYSFWKHEEELSRSLKTRCEKLLELDSTGFEMHTFECLCGLDDNEEDCTCGAWKRNQELIAEGNDPEFMRPI